MQLQLEWVFARTTRMVRISGATAAKLEFRDGSVKLLVGENPLVFQRSQLRKLGGGGDLAAAAATAAEDSSGVKQNQQKPLPPRWMPPVCWRRSRRTGRSRTACTGGVRALASG